MFNFIKHFENFKDFIVIIFKKNKKYNPNKFCSIYSKNEKTRKSFDEKG